MTPNTFAENINAAENKTYADDKNLNVEITNGITFDVSKLFDALEIFDVSDKIIADYKEKKRLDIFETSNNFEIKYLANSQLEEILPVKNFDADFVHFDEMKLKSPLAASSQFHKQELIDSKIQSSEIIKR